MKTHKVIFGMVVFFAAITVSAQPQHKPMKERVESMKIGFLTERLNLSPEEAKVFWPVYNKYSDELEALRKSHREKLADAREGFEEMKDGEVEKLVDNEITFRQNELDVLKKYHPQFKQVLPVKKVARLYRSEEDFKRKLLEMIQEKKGQRKDKMH